MAGFTEPALQKKLVELNNTLPSVQTLSLWLLHHRKHSSNIVKVWYNELRKERQSRKLLNLVYLANDVIQNARKKWPLFQEQFKEVLEKALAHVARHSDAATLTSVRRVLQVWRQRQIYDADFLTRVAYAVTSNLSADMLVIFNKKENAARTPPPQGSTTTPAVAEDAGGGGGGASTATAKRRHTVASGGGGGGATTGGGSTTPPTVVSSSAIGQKTENAGDQSASTTATKLMDQDDRGKYTPSGPPPGGAVVGGQSSPLAPPVAAANDDSSSSTASPTPRQLLFVDFKSPDDVIGEAPPTDELIGALKLLEKPASADVETRQRIAQFPADIADVSKLRNLTTQFQADRFAQVVDEAGQLLKAYNQKLSDEMAHRASTLEMLDKFGRAQKCLLEKDAEDLARWKLKLDQLTAERDELHQHIDSLPDLSKLPDFSRLAPLPSAGELFMK